MAMGGATASLTGSPLTCYHNPAGIVWQLITGGVGIQPVSFSEYPKSWWLHLYNRTTEYGFPLSLVAGGWDAPTFDGSRRNMFIGMPLAYKLSPYSPAAVDLKWAFERTPDGTWIAGVPMDFGFMARTDRGANIGWVFRNVTLGPNRFESFKTRMDYGIAYEMGIATMSISSTAESIPEARENYKDRYRLGFELASNPQVVFRGGFVHWEGDEWYTGGVGLRTAEGGMYVDYAVVYDTADKNYTHFLQYIYMIRPRK